MNSILISLFFLMPLHDIHVSVSEIKIDSSNQIEISIKIFYDDLLSAVGLTPRETLPSDYTSADDLIIRYLTDHFYITINGEKLSTSLVETNAFGDAVWIDLKGSIKGHVEILEIEIFNDIFIELFDDQSNLVKVNYNEKAYSDLLSDNKLRFYIKT